MFYLHLIERNSLSQDPDSNGSERVLLHMQSMWPSLNESVLNLVNCICIHLWQVRPLRWTSELIQADSPCMKCKNREVKCRKITISCSCSLTGGKCCCQCCVLVLFGSIGALFMEQAWSIIYSRSSVIDNSSWPCFVFFMKLVSNSQS